MDAEQKTRLLVPMDIEALLVGQAGGSSWVDLKPDFRSIYFNQFLGQQLESRPFGPTVSDLHGPGVHLHWALPDGLTHGSQEPGEDLKFPLVPNRWLVVRYSDQGTEKNAQFLCRTWIVESDTVTGDDNAQSWPHLSSENPRQEKDYRVFVGKRFDFAGWQEQSSTERIDITAAGYGDPSFAAFYPACKGILGFHDGDLDGLENTTLNYFVAGWYSSASYDPLHQATERAVPEFFFAALSDFLNEKRWTYPGFAEAFDKAQQLKKLKADLKEQKEMAQRLAQAATGVSQQNQDAAAAPPVAAHVARTQEALQSGGVELQNQIAEKEKECAALAQQVDALRKQLPSEILCHGTITGIRWQTKDTLYDTGIPRGQVKVSAGDTAVEALAALFKGQLNDELVKLLEAFHYDLLHDLETPGGDDTFEQKVHERRYGRLEHGILWDLLADQTADQKNSEEKTPPIPGEVRAMLEKLNVPQRRINQLKRDRDAAASELYAAWYKTVLNSTENNGDNQALLNQQMATLQAEMDRLTAALSAQQDEREGRPKGNEWDQLQASIALFAPEYKLQAVEEARFWRPNDPVMLLAGPTLQRSPRHGEDGRYRKDGLLLCRVTGQQITALQVTIPRGTVQTFGPQDIDQWCNPFPQGKPWPEIVDLFRESLLLLPASNRAYAIAYAIYEKNESGVAGKSAAEVARLKQDLADWFLKLWKDAADPEIGQLDLRHEAGQTLLELTGAFPSPVMRHVWEKNPWLPLFLQWQVDWRPGSTSQYLQSWKLNESGTHFEWNGNAPADEQHLYSGTVLLTSSATWTFSERLRQYNLIHENPALKKLQTAVRSMSVLCQSLGGFTDNLLMRKGLLELRPLAPGAGGAGPKLSPIFDRVKDVEWLSPLTDAALYPLRAGHLKVLKLRVVDAFGQLYDVEQDSLDGIMLSPELAGPPGFIQLGPRLAQHARLAMRWPAASDSRWNAVAGNGAEDTDKSPVCGWVLPNFFDDGLMIYDARGNALGALQAVKRKSWEQGAGGRQEQIEGFHWVGLPGTDSFYFGQPSVKQTDPLGKKANPHLREFVKGLLSVDRQSGEALAGLLDSMSQALSNSSGSSASGQNPSLALLIGRPLALVRASLAFELDGWAARSQSIDDLLKVQTGGIEEVKVSARLGDRRQWHDVWLGDDGLVGFFQDQNYTRFSPAYGLAGRNDSYNQYNTVPETSIGAPLDLTLLVDPSRGISVTTGILPRQTFQLPFGDIIETLEHKQVIFYTGPVVGPKPEGHDRKILMPQPSDIYGQWSWTHHTDIEVWQETAIADTQKDSGYFSEIPLAISEGWLKLVTAPLSVRVFTVKGKNAVHKAGTRGQTADEFEVQRGEKSILSWTAIGANEIELWQDTTLAFRSGQHPLPSQRVVQVNKDASFTLVAIARPDPLSTGDAPPQQERKTINIKVT